jgi:hypothetical protein
VITRWDTPPDYRKAGRRPGRWKIASETLRQEPGRWGVVAEGLSYRENETGRQCLRELGCEVRTQKVDGVGHEIWAMWPA